MEHSCSAHEGPGCIACVPIFSGLSPREMEEVAAITVDKTYEKGELIYFAGKESRKLYVIHKGNVKISRVNDEGKSQVLRVLGPGEFMGELAVLNDSPLMDYAEALSPCDMCMVDGLRLKELMRKYPSIALKIMEVTSVRLEKAERLIEDINLNSAEHRLAQALLDLSGGTQEFELPLTKGDFASQLGMTQETLSRKLAALQDRKLIELKGQRTIIIRNWEGLKRPV